MAQPLTTAIVMLTGSKRSDLVSQILWIRKSKARTGFGLATYRYVHTESIAGQYKTELELLRLEVARLREAGGGAGGLHPLATDGR